MNLNKITILLFISLGLVILSACKKDESNESWNSCYSCSIDSWTGSWKGTASVFNAQTNNTTDGFDVNVEISETGTNYLTISITIPNQYSSTLSGELLTGYSISFASSNNSFDGTLFRKDGEFKISGNAKKFYYKVNELVIETVVTFDITPLSAD